MAPMAGVTDAPFRRRLRRNGCRALFTEMVSAAALARANPRTLAYLCPTDLAPDLGIQLFGAHPEELAAAAAAAEEAGFRHVDFNMGCPVRKVVRSGAGAALLRDTERAARCLAALRRSVRGTLSAKIRIGWDAESLNASEIGRIAAGEGVDLLTVHGRTRAQGYAGCADWRPIEALARELPIPVVGNGDVASAPDAVRRMEAGVVAGVMIGRAALASPWIFGHADRLLQGAAPPPPPTAEERGEDLVLHLEDLEAEKGARVALFEARKFVAWGCRGLAGAAEFRRRIQGHSDMGLLRDEVRAYFSGRSADDRASDDGGEPDEEWLGDACDAA